VARAILATESSDIQTPLLSGAFFFSAALIGNRDWRAYGSALCDKSTGHVKPNKKSAPIGALYCEQQKAA
jgi:hypothetical protein